MVATSSPPLNAMASGLQNTDPMSGIIPSMAAIAVSMIGLNRNVAELMMASRADCPSARCISIWSNRMMELRMIMPERAIMPRIAIKPSGVRVIFRASTTPMRPSGAVNNAINIRAILFNWNMRIVIIAKSIIGIGTSNFCTAVTLFSAEPSRSIV